jgi:hypothetical protein
MSKRKKKPSLQSQQKISKAQHHNEFIRDLKEILDKAVGPEIFRLIPPAEIDNLYMLRCQPVRLKAGPGQKIPAAVLKELKSLSTLLFKNNYIDTGIGELSNISLYDFFSLGLTIILYAIRLKEDAYPFAAKVKKALESFADIENNSVYQEAMAHYSRILTTMSIFNSSISAGLYALKHCQSSVDDRSITICFYVEVYYLQAPKIQIPIGGHHRPAYRLGWPVTEPVPHLKFTDVSSEKLGFPPGDLLEVYIQSHALNRLFERMDVLDPGLLCFNIFLSFVNLKVCKSRKGNWLFEYTVLGNKTGYFVGEVIDKRIILKTFLFLTNNGTPESEKLYATTGITKEDKVYLTIDKLSVFLDSDIVINERVKQLFIDAGCESLFKIDKSLRLPREGDGERSIADFIVKYLRLDKPFIR